MNDTNTVTDSRRSHEGPRLREIIDYLNGYEHDPIDREDRVFELIIADLKDADAEVSEDEYPAPGTLEVECYFPVADPMSPPSFGHMGDSTYIVYATRRQHLAARWRDRAMRWKATSSELLSIASMLSGPDHASLLDADSQLNRAIVVAEKLGGVA